MGRGQDGGCSRVSDDFSHTRQALGNIDIMQPDQTAAPGQRGNNGAAEEERLRFSQSIVRALAEAEVAQSRLSSAQAQASLAEGAYQRLCYDFPFLREEELQALAVTTKAHVQEAGDLRYPLIPRFLAGLSYLATPKRPDPDRMAPAGENHNNVSVSAGGESEKRFACIQTIAVCVLLKAVAPPLAAAAKGNLDPLQNLLARYEEFAEESWVGEEGSELGEEGRGHLSSPPFEELRFAEQEDNTDDEWEPLETPVRQPLRPLFPVDLQAAPSTPRHPLEWTELASRLCHLASFARYEMMSSNRIWNDTDLTPMHSLSSILASLTTLGTSLEPALFPALTSYTALLKSRLLACPQGTLKGSDSLKEALPAVLKAWVGFTKGKELAVGLLHDLVVGLGGGSDVAQGGQGLVSRGTGRHLWVEVAGALPVLAEQLEGLVQQKSPTHEWLRETEALLCVLDFYVCEAPKGEDVAAALLQTGIVREALLLFGRVGDAPPMEHLRHFLLISAAVAPALARYAGAVPSFMSVLRSVAYQDLGGPAGLHALLWPLLLSPGGVQGETYAAAFVESATASLQRTEAAGVVKIAVELGRLQRFLTLLQAITRAAPGGQLWIEGGILQSALASCTSAARAYAASCLPLETSYERSSEHSTVECLEPARSSRPLDGTAPSSSQLMDIRSPNEQAFRGNGRVQGSSEEPRDLLQGFASDSKDSAKDKVVEILPSVLGQLKDLLGFARGGAIGKND